ncbi:hypothetical protein ACTFIW_005392 [Dictyostelium discoideum]
MLLGLKNHQIRRKPILSYLLKRFPNISKNEVLKIKYKWVRGCGHKYETTGNYINKLMLRDGNIKGLINTNCKLMDCKVIPNYVTRIMDFLDLQVEQQVIQPLDKSILDSLAKRLIEVGYDNLFSNRISIQIKFVKCNHSKEYNITVKHRSHLIVCKECPIDCKLDTFISKCFDLIQNELKLKLVEPIEQIKEKIKNFDEFLKYPFLVVLECGCNGKIFDHSLSYRIKGCNLTFAKIMFCPNHNKKKTFEVITNNLFSIIENNNLFNEFNKKENFKNQIKSHSDITSLLLDSFEIKFSCHKETKIYLTSKSLLEWDGSVKIQCPSCYPEERIDIIFLNLFCLSSNGYNILTQYEKISVDNFIKMKSPCGHIIKLLGKEILYLNNNESFCETCNLNGQIYNLCQPHSILSKIRL